MMNRIKHLLLAVLTFTIFQSAFAGHLIGGTMDYKCVGDSTEMSLSLYMEPTALGSGNTPSSAIFNIFRHTNSGMEIVEMIDVLLTDIDTIYTQYTSACGSNTYSDSMYSYNFVHKYKFDPSDRGYMVSYWRCCRPDNSSNVNEENGIALTIDIPDSTINCNSGPEFNALPPKFVCLNDNFNINSSASDADGDSLVYSLCSPLTAGNADTVGQLSTLLDPYVLPPYDTLSYLSGYHGNNPFGNGNIRINSETGIITGNPGELGSYFVLGVCVEEFRGGVSISKSYRDIPIAVVACDGLLDVEFGSNDTSSLGYNCSREVSFRNTSLGGNFYNWDFGVADSTNDTSILYEPTYTFPDTGVYSVTLISGDSNDVSCLDTLVQVIKISDGLDVDIDVSKECDSLDVDFVNLSIVDSTALPITFEWIVSGLDTVTAENANITFVTSGDYNVNFSVIDAKGCEGDTSFVYPFSASAIADFSISGDTSKACSTLVTFSNSSVGSTDFFWDFGDLAETNDTSLERNPTYDYPSSADYSVSLIAGDSACADTMTRTISVFNAATAQFTTTTSCNSGQVIFTDATLNGRADSMFWDFADGNGEQKLTSPQTVNYSSNDDYSVTYRIIDSNGCENSFNQTVSVNFIQASFSLLGGGVTSCQLDNQFTNTTTGADSYIWNFGDSTTLGDTSVVQNATYDFPSNGDYDVSLISVNESCRDTLVRRVSVFGGPTLFPIIRNGCDRDSVTFSDSSFVTGGGIIVKRIWTFGDGTADSTNDVISKLYATERVYNVNYSVEDNNGCVADTNISVPVIFPINLGFDFDVQGDSLRLCGKEINVENSAFGLDFGLVEIDFGDGSSFVVGRTDDSVISHTYAQNGQYTVRSNAVRTIGGLRCDTSLIRTLLVSDPVEPIFTFAPDCDSLKWLGSVDQRIKDQIRDFVWIENDTLHQSDSLYYNEPSEGSLTIALHLTDTNGCNSDSSLIVNYKPIPEAEFEVLFDGDSLFSGENAILNDLSDFNDSITWTIDAGDSVFLSLGDTAFVFRAKGWHSVLQTLKNGTCDAEYLDSVFVHHQLKVEMPEIFSPGNNDGQNDEFRFFASGIENFKVSIFDRWGKLVFESDDVSATWDGTNLKQQELPPGEYLFYISGIDAEEQISISEVEEMKDKIRGKILLVR